MESAQVRGSDTESHFWKYFVLIIRASTFQLLFKCKATGFVNVPTGISASTLPLFHF